MKIKKTKFKDLVILQTKNYTDNRGYFKEVFKHKLLNQKFIFDCMSFSKKNTLRGLHFQSKNPQGKLLTVLSGKIFDVAVDLRKNSKTFGKHFSIIIDSKSNFSIYIPPNFAHGFLCLSKTCSVYYKCTTYRDKISEKTLFYNDPKLKIKWPGRNFLLSKKDKCGQSFNEFFK